MNDIIILGAGGNCLDILDSILELNRTVKATPFRVLGFLDDNPRALEGSNFGYEVIGTLRQAAEFKDCCFVNGIGSFRNYWKKPDIIALTGLPIESFVTLIHPRAAVSAFAQVGRGSVILQNATINARARIGDHVIVLPNAVVSHDCVVSDFCCVASGACLAGGVRVERASYLGANCSINNDVGIGENALVGMGSVVLRDVPARAVVVGCPARVIRRLEDIPAKAP